MSRRRKDYYFWRLHLIVRGYTDEPQYGILMWRCLKRDPWTLDIWFGQTLYTFRKTGC
jgi:hypothetical protein